MARPASDREREFKYRFAQGMVFGLPVVVLEWAGYRLGGSDAGRWVGLMQALLGGWVLYVAGAGMLFEGILVLLRARRVMSDLVVSLAGTGIYLYSLVAWGLRLRADAGPPMAFHWSVILLTAWALVRWRGWTKRG